MGPQFPPTGPEERQVPDGSRSFLVSTTQLTGLLISLRFGMCMHRLYLFCASSPLHLKFYLWRILYINVLVKSTPLLPFFFFFLDF